MATTAVGQGALEAAGVAVGQAAQAQHDVRFAQPGLGEQARGQPVESEIERLQRLPRKTAAGGGCREPAPGAERQQGDFVAGGREGAGEEEGVPLGAAAAEPVLDDKNFHCSVEARCECRAIVAMKGILNLLLRWAIVAIGVALAAKLVPGISCPDGWTLFLVVILLGLFNAFLKPLIVVFTLPFVILSAGLGLWLINALILYLTGKVLAPDFQVAGFGSALLGSLIISVTNLLLTRLLSTPVVRRPPAPPPGAPPAGPGDVIDV